MAQSVTRFTPDLGNGRHLFFVGVRAYGELYCHPVYARTASEARTKIMPSATPFIDFVVRIVRWKP